jgi:ABC-type Na+ efflux pump permease subunit
MELAEEIRRVIRDEFATLRSEMATKQELATVKSLMLETVELISGVDAKVDALENKVDALRVEVDNFKSEVQATDSKNMLRQLLLEEDLRRVRVEMKEIDERLRKLEQSRNQ